MDYEGDTCGLPAAKSSYLSTFELMFPLPETSVRFERCIVRVRRTWVYGKIVVVPIGTVGQLPAKVVEETVMCAYPQETPGRGKNI